MTDWGFTEILLILIVGLAVLGPEKLPGALRNGYRWYLHLSRKFQDTKEELKHQLHSEAIISTYKESKAELAALDESVRSTHLDLLDSFDNK